jgi:hypothetical protein
MKLIIKSLKITSLTLLTLILLYFALLFYPNPLFAYHVNYHHCAVYSDQPIDGNIKNIIDDVTLRLSKSELYDSGIHFQIFICNEQWRFMLLNQGNKKSTGITETHLTRHIYFRQCDIANNKIIPRAGAKFTYTDRPLAYYFAHEMTHVLQSHYTGRFSLKKTPAWLQEGYADYIGKSGNFDFDENLKLLRQNAPELDPKQGLYSYYQLLVTYLLDKKKLSIKSLYQNIPKENEIKNKILRLNEK